VGFVASQPGLVRENSPTSAHTMIAKNPKSKFIATIAVNVISGGQGGRCGKQQAGMAKVIVGRPINGRAAGLGGSCRDRPDRAWATRTVDCGIKANIQARRIFVKAIGEAEELGTGDGYSQPRYVYLQKAGVGRCART